MKTLTMIAPDDWHCHLRDGAALSRTVVDQARYFSRSIVMPNLVPPVETVEQAEAYHQRILQYVPKGSDFTPLMALYLTESMTAETIHAAKASEIVYAIKLYPAGATTHSDAGVVDFQQIYPVLAVMEEVGVGAAAGSW